MLWYLIGAAIVGAGYYLLNKEKVEPPVNPQAVPSPTSSKPSATPTPTAQDITLVQKWLNGWTDAMPTNAASKFGVIPMMGRNALEDAGVMGTATKDLLGRFQGWADDNLSAGIQTQPNFVKGNLDLKTYGVLKNWFQSQP